LWLKESDHFPELGQLLEKEVNRPAAEWMANYLHSNIDAGRLDLAPAPLVAAWGRRSA